ncbi:MAG: TIM barrel protein, partial [Bacteroidota bacterium]
METLEIIKVEEKIQKEVYKMNFAPHIGLTSPNDGMFIHHAGTDPVDQIKFIADQGFRAIEDNFLKMRSKAEQERIARELELQGMTMGVFVHNLDTWNEAVFVSDTQDSRNRLITEVKSTIETAKRVNGKWATLLSGHFDPALERSYQKVNMIENLKAIAEIAEMNEVVLGIEAINSREFPGTFLSKVTEVYEIVKAVNSPSIKIMFNLYMIHIE